jgi:hypothetical protein
MDTSRTHAYTVIATADRSIKAENQVNTVINLSHVDISMQIKYVKEKTGVINISCSK